jgi:hypothetical protein
VEQPDDLTRGFGPSWLAVGAHEAIVGRRRYPRLTSGLCSLVLPIGQVWARNPTNRALRGPNASPKGTYRQTSGSHLADKGHGRTHGEVHARRRTLRHGTATTCVAYCGR